MNNFDQTFVLAFYNSFLKARSNWDKENKLILNTCSSQKSMLSTFVLIYSLVLKADVS